MTHQVSIKIGEEELILETGKMAKQANGAVFASYGGTAVLATACASNNVLEGLDFVPLQVEYNEKYYAAGKIPGGYLKREARPKDKEILVSRLIDRPLRPLFDKAFGREIQVVPTVVSTDQINTPDIVAINAASAAVTISDIPFNGPIAAVRIGKIDDEYIVNPTFQQIEKCKLEIIVAGTMDGITMVEGGAKEVSEDDMLEAIAKAHPVIKDLCKAQLKLKELAGKEKLPVIEVEEDLTWLEEVKEFAYPLVKEASFVKGKMERYAALKEAHNQVEEKFATLLEEDEKRPSQLSHLYDELEYEILRDSILNEGVRTDGRKVDDIRQISCEVGLLPKTHGSALFTRGETQSLATTTLGTASDEQMFDNIDGEKSFSPFMLHYNFPPYSVGEAGFLRGPGRREIGHGHLAERSLKMMMPSFDDFGYVIRIISDITESNGSSSMASVCGGSMALMSAGVPLKKPVAGIAMGMIVGEDNSVVLSDIRGEEDFMGDMDFKTAGTADGITACQMDMKVKGISFEVMEEALKQAHTGRLHILGKMAETISAPSETLSEFAPQFINMTIDGDMIGAVIGPGGKVIQTLQKETDTEIWIEEDESGKGKITISADSLEKAEDAQNRIKAITGQLEEGATYKGEVKSIKDFGAFVEIAPGRDGLLHISEIDHSHVKNVTDYMSVGDEIEVKLLKIEPGNKLRLSRKALLSKDEEE